jgi:hypothetical protein
MNNIELIDGLLSKYEIDAKIPEEVRKEMARMKKAVLINVLKSAGKYTLFTAVLINLILLAKKIGLGVSAAKVNIAVKAVLIVSTSTAAVTTGTVVYHHISKSARSTVAVPVQTAAPESKPTEAAVPEQIPSYRYEIVSFSCPPELAGESEEFSKKIYDMFISLQGENAAVFADKNKKYRSELTIIGSFTKIGNTRYISVRLVNPADSRIIRIINKSAVNETDIESLPESIVKEL